MLIKLKVVVRQSQGKVLQAFGGPSGGGHGDWTHVDIDESCVARHARWFASLVLEIGHGQDNLVV